MSGGAHTAQRNIEEIKNQTAENTINNNYNWPQSPLPTTFRANQFDTPSKALYNFATGIKDSREPDFDDMIPHHNFQGNFGAETEAYQMESIAFMYEDSPSRISKNQ